MMKKYYILVFKLLSLFLGQSSYAIGQGDYGYDDNYGTNWWHDVKPILNIMEQMLKNMITGVTIKRHIPKISQN